MAQFGSVLEWGSRGRKFESSHPDHKRTLILIQGSAFFLYPESLAPQGAFILPGAGEALSPCSLGSTGDWRLKMPFEPQKNSVRPLKIRGRIRYNKATCIMNRPRSRTARQKEEEHMKNGWRCCFAACCACAPRGRWRRSR